MAGPAQCSNQYCVIPAGQFQIGQTFSDYDEQPVKVIQMSGFYLGRTEVSVGDYQAYIARNSRTQLQAVISGCNSKSTSQTLLAKTNETETDFYNRAVKVFSSNACTKMEIIHANTTPALPAMYANQKGGEFPVVGLTMDEKRAYCQAQGGDLPTAAQLHYASIYDFQDGASKRITRESGYKSTQPVTAGYQNRFGIYNLLGNVWESSRDAYDFSFYSRMTFLDPYNPMHNPWSPKNPQGQYQEFSGGAFGFYEGDARPANRYYAGPNERYAFIGFRCAVPLP